MPLHEPDAKKLVRAILDRGTFVVTAHARTEMRKDKLTDVDVVNVLRGGVAKPAEYENGAWRYRVETQRMVVVAEFEPEPEDGTSALASAEEMTVVVVTAWRLR